MENATPIPGVDYPRTFVEMDECFRTEAGCRAYIQRLRWPGGFVCECCSVVGEPWVSVRGVFDAGHATVARRLRLARYPRTLTNHFVCGFWQCGF